MEGQGVSQNSEQLLGDGFNHVENNKDVTGTSMTHTKYEWIETTKDEGETKAWMRERKNMILLQKRGNVWQK